MKKKVLSLALAATIFCGISMPAIATPNQTEVQKRYEELKKKEEAIHNKIEDMNLEIEPIIVKSQENKRRINELNKQIENTGIEIEDTKKEIEEKQEMLSLRLREIYKSGGQADIISIIFSAESFGELITRVTLTSKLAKADKKVVKEVKDKQEKLDQKMTSLQEKSVELNNLNAETESQLAELNGKIKEQNALIAQAKAETKQYEKEFLEVEERIIIKDLVATCKNSNASLSAIETARTQLNAIVRTQLKSQVVINEAKEAIRVADELIRRKKEEQNNNNNNGGNNNGGNNNGGNNNGGNNGGGGGAVTPPSGSAQAVVNEAYSHLGKPYEWGATGPNTFDCSGLTSSVYKKVTGKWIGRTTYNQIDAGREVSRAELQPGDLVFTHPGHVGIYIGNGNMIHAPQTGDVVKVSNVYKFWRARRIL